MQEDQKKNQMPKKKINLLFWIFIALIINLGLTLRLSFQYNDIALEQQKLEYLDMKLIQGEVVIFKILENEQNKKENINEKF